MSIKTAESVQFVVRGVCYSMKNSKTLTWRAGKLRTIKHEKAQQFERDFLYQVPAEYRNLALSQPLRFICTVYYPDRRQDLDVALVADLLQKAGVIENDRQLVEQHLYREVDKDNPRVEIILEIL